MPPVRILGKLCVLPNKFVTAGQLELTTESPVTAQSSLFHCRNHCCDFYLQSHLCDSRQANVMTGIAIITIIIIIHLTRVIADLIIVIAFIVVTVSVIVDRPSL